MASAYRWWWAIQAVTPTDLEVDRCWARNIIEPREAVISVDFTLPTRQFAKLVASCMLLLRRMGLPQKSFQSELIVRTLGDLAGSPMVCSAAARRTFAALLKLPSKQLIGLIGQYTCQDPRLPCLRHPRRPFKNLTTGDVNLRPVQLNQCL